MAQDTPLLSIIVASYNFKEYLIPCLESILAQETQYPYEVIIIDDCSSDGSWDLIQKYNTEHRFSDRIHIYQSSENQGSARGAMFNTRPVVKSRYIALLDGDDLWHSKDKIQKQISFLENNPDFDGCTHLTALHHEENTSVKGKGWGVVPGSIWTIKDVMIKLNRQYCHKSANIWRNQFIQDDGFFLPDFMQDKVYFNDMTMSALFASKGGKIMSMNGLLSVYRMHGKGVWNSRDQEYYDKTHVREWYAIDAATQYQFHDLINVRILDLCVHYEKSYGKKAPVFKPELLPDNVTSIPAYSGIDDDQSMLDALKALLSKTQAEWAETDY